MNYLSSCIRPVSKWSAIEMFQASEQVAKYRLTRRRGWKASPVSDSLRADFNGPRRPRSSFHLSSSGHLNAGCRFGPETGTAEARPALTTPPRFRHRPYAFDMSSVVSLRSSSCQSPDLVLPRPFPSVLPTRAFDQGRRRWFGTCSCQPVPRGQPSSIKQLHTLGPRNAR